MSLRCALGAFLVSILLVSLSAHATPRERIAWNAEWRFLLGDPAEGNLPAADLPDWRAVTLPHDWSIALPVDEQAPAGGHGGFFPTGAGWYRKEFVAPETWRGRIVTLEFEGVALHAEVSLNGHTLGRQPYGYLPLRVDLTPHLQFGKRNVIAVRVDNSAQPSSRWYTGSGVYRPVWLHVTNPVHVALDGAWAATTSLESATAELRVETTVINAGATNADVTISHQLVSPEGSATEFPPRPLSVAPGAEAVGHQLITVARPIRWTPQEPALYRLVTRVRSGATLLDEVTTVTGIRTVQWSAERGFELNGATVELNGGNVHHDTGPLGAASFARAEERKVELLKAAGFNAVRTAHNPPSRAFLEACDRLGLFVMNEIFDGWEKAKTKHDHSRFFRDGWQRDVDAWVRRDRHHPSVVIWSTGNEMFERGNADGQRIARELVARIRGLDPTRPVTAGVNGMGKNGSWEQLDPLFAAFDLAGYNYELTRHAADHARLPARIIVAAESYQSEVFANWAAAQEHAYVIGDFVWSALDYLGESGIGRVYAPDEPPLKHWEGSMWPWHGAYCGDLDLTGWRKPVSHYRNIVWDRGEKLYAAVVAPAPGGKPWNVTPWSMPPALPSWTWRGQEGTALAVEVYSRHESVRLELNGRLIGEAPTERAQEFRAKFEVPYAPGELVALGLQGGRVVERFTLRTAQPVATLRVRVDRAELKADAQDLAFITVEAVDAHGVVDPTAALPVSCAVEGAGDLAAFGTGDLTSREGYRVGTRTLFQGRALAVVRTRTSAGSIEVQFTAPGLPVQTVTLKSQIPVSSR
jgi:beta-galactosidase